MPRPAFHFHPYSGRRCYCPWGRTSAYLPKRQSSVEKLAGPHLHKVLKRQEKRLRTDEGERYLEALRREIEHYPDADPLVPFLTQRWKKGEISVYPAQVRGVMGEPRPENQEDRLSVRDRSPLRNVLPRWTQWYNARQHPLRRGVNVMDPNFRVEEIGDLARKHQEALEEEEQKERHRESFEHGESVHQFPDGWHIHHLNPQSNDYYETGDALRAEGDWMGHCIGDEEGQPYYNAALDGSIDVYSLRDPKNIPHATFHFNPDGSLAHVQGRSGQPNEGYTDRIDEYLAPRGISTQNQVGDQGFGQPEVWWPDRYEVEGPTTLDELRAHQNGSYHEYAPDEYNNATEEAQENGLEGPDLIVGDPDWYDIVDDLIRQGRYEPEKGQELLDLTRGQGPYSTGNHEEVLEALNQHNHEWSHGSQENWDQMLQPPRQILDHPDPFERQKMIENHQRQVLQENDLTDDPWYQMFHHLGPQLDEDYDYPGMPYKLPWQEKPQEESFLQESPYTGEWAYPMYDVPTHQQEYYNPPGGPGGSQRVPLPLSFSKVASNSAPTYYRWVFSPATGDVDLGHNWEGHPATIDYHGAMAAERNEPNLVHGYAYRILGGWRLTDWQSKPVEDPYITAQVIRALREREGMATPQNSSEQPETDFDQSHYGLPLAVQ